MKKNKLEGLSKIIFANNDIILGNFNENKLHESVFIFNSNGNQWILTLFKKGKLMKLLQIRPKT